MGKTSTKCEVSGMTPRPKLADCQVTIMTILQPDFRASHARPSQALVVRPTCAVFGCPCSRCLALTVRRVRSRLGREGLPQFSFGWILEIEAT